MMREILTWDYENISLALLKVVTTAVDTTGLKENE